MLHGVGLLRRFGIAPSRALAFAQAVGAHMGQPAFHNLHHVLMVSATAFRFLALSAAAAEALDDVDALVVMVGSMVHDLAHNCARF
jgi:hypothetical protein